MTQAERIQEFKCLIGSRELFRYDLQAQVVNLLLGTMLSGVDEDYRNWAAIYLANGFVDLAQVNQLEASGDIFEIFSTFRMKSPSAEGCSLSPQSRKISATMA